MPGPPASNSLSTAPMHGGPVLPTIGELQRLPDPPHHHFRPLYSVSPAPLTTTHGPRGSNGSPQMIPRPPSQLQLLGHPASALSEESPAKKQSKWTPEEDNLTIELRGQGIKWDDIAKRLPGRSAISCRLRYQNYLEKRAVWDEEKKNKLARLYARFKDQMWQKVATEMGIPWRSAESMHWQLGEQEMSARANAPVFQLHPSATAIGSPTQAHASPASHGFTPLNSSKLVPDTTYRQQQPSPPHSSGSIHSYHHQRKDNHSTWHDSRRENLYSSLKRHSNPLPQLKPTSEADTLSSARTTPSLGPRSGIKREGDSGTLTEPSVKRRREDDDGDDDGSSLRSTSEARSHGGRSPGRGSSRSRTGSFKSSKQGEADSPRSTSNDLEPANRSPHPAGLTRQVDSATSIA